MLGGGFAAVVGLFTFGITNFKKIKKFLKDDYHKIRMELGCKRCMDESVKICPECYRCENCKKKRCKTCCE